MLFSTNNVFAKASKSNNISQKVLDKVNKTMSHSQTPSPEIKAWEIDFDGNMKEGEPISKKNSFKSYSSDEYVYIFDKYNLNNCMKNWNYQIAGTCRIVNTTNRNVTKTYKQPTTKQTKANVSTNITASTEIKTKYLNTVKASTGVTAGWEKTWIKGREYGISYTIPSRNVVYVTNYQVGIDTNGELVYKKISKQRGFVGYYYESAGGTVLDEDDSNIELTETAPQL